MFNFTDREQSGKHTTTRERGHCCSVLQKINEVTQHEHLRRPNTLKESEHLQPHSSYILPSNIFQHPCSHIQLQSTLLPRNCRKFSFESIKTVGRHSGFIFFFTLTWELRRCRPEPEDHSLCFHPAPLQTCTWKHTDTTGKTGCWRDERKEGKDKN